MHGVTSWEGFGVNSPPVSRSTPYHLTLFTRSLRLYHMKLYISLFPVSHLTLFNNCVLHPLYIMHVLWGMQVQAKKKALTSFQALKWPANSIFSHTQCSKMDLKLLSVLGMMKYADSSPVQCYSETTRVYLPVCSPIHPCHLVWARLTAVP